MRKLYLTLLLFIGSLGVGWAQYYAHYDFSTCTNGDWSALGLQNQSYEVNLSDGGYNDGWGADELKVQVGNFNLNQNGTRFNPLIFAFNPISVSNTWDQGNYIPAWRVTPASDDKMDVRGIKNMSPNPNVFSVLNLRAGEIVRIKSYDHQNGATVAMKDRFIINHSANAIENNPYLNENDHYLGTAWTQEFIMLKDGNLDLKVVPFLKITEIDIISKYDDFKQGRAKVGTPISVTIPCGNMSTIKPCNIDYTSSVGQNRWDWQNVNSNTTPNPGGVTMVERYGDSSEGHKLWQTVSNLPNGIYRAEVYATSHNARGEDGASLNGTSDNTAYVYAIGNDEEQREFFIARGVTPGFENGEPNVCEINNIVVNNGQLEIGMGLARANQTGWHCIQIKSLTRVGEFQNIYAQSEPVVYYCGDLTPGTVNVSKSDGNWNVTVSGFSGKQSSDGYWEGGTIIIMVDNHMYSYAVPYNVNKSGNAEFASWNFWQNPLYVGRAAQQKYESLMSHDVAEGSFSLVYENTNDREPLYEYNGIMNGQNAYFHPETAGLIFETNANQKYGILNENAGAEPDGLRYIGLKNGSSLTIPDLDPGDEVWVYFDHFGASSARTHDDSSLGFYVTNAADALNHPIASNEVVTAGGATWGPEFFNSNKEAKVYVGAMHFYSTGGDMTFTPSFYTNFNIMKICYIRLVKHNPQNIITKTNSILHYNSGYELLTTQDAAGNYTNSTATWRLHECGRGQSNQRWMVREASGNLSAYEINGKIDNTNHTLTDGIGAYDGNPGHANNIWFRYTTKNEPTYGSFLLRCMDYDFDNKYCFDYADRVIAVGYRQTMNYPYTWDFTDILNSKTGNSQAEYDFSAATSRPEGEAQPVGGIYSDTQQYNGSTIWMNDTTSVWVKYDNVISLQNARIRNENNRTLSSGTQLFAGNTYIEEAAGLGWATINMDANYNGSIQILDKGVKIQSYNGWETRLFVPAANKTGRIYVRGQKLNDGKGFVAKAFKGAAFGPNTMKAYSTDPRVNLTALLPEGQTETVFYYEGNFSTYIEGQQDIAATKHYDDYLEAIVGGPGTKMEERLGSDRTVDNPTTLYDEAGYEGRITKEAREAYEYDEFGNITATHTVYEIVSDNNVYLNDQDTHDVNLALFDRNVTLCNTIGENPITDFVYTNFIYTGGSGKSTPEAGRYLQLTLPKSDYEFKVTVVARSQSSRQINVFSGTTWGNEANALATMVVQNNLVAKTLVAPAGTTSLLIGSDNSAVEIYAIYVEEKKTVSANDSEQWAGYVDVDASDGGVTLYLNDIIIEKLAYSTDVKTLNDIGWASESRDHYIDHSLTEYFTNNPVKAYVTSGTATNSDNLINAITLKALGADETSNVMELSEGNQSVSETDETYSGTGCILYNSNNETVEGGLYLFVPDIHDYMDDAFLPVGSNNANFKGDALTNGSPISTGTKSHANAKPAKIYAMGDNMMIANLTGQAVPYSPITADYTYYVLSYRYTDKAGVQHPTANETPEERFVRVNKEGATGSANTAYLRLKTTDVKPNGWNGTEANLIILFDGEEGNDPDGINEIDLSTVQDESENGTYEYYTISGQKVNKPNKPGIYVRNGKKVYVK